MQVIVFYWGEFLKTDVARCFYNIACYQLSKHCDCFFFRKIFIWPTFRFSLVFSRRSVRVIQSAVIDSAIVTEEWKKRGRFGTSRVMNTIFTRSDPDLARFFNPLLLSCRLLLRFILLTKRPEQVIWSENGKVGFQKILNELALKKYLAYIREADCNWGFE